MRGVVIGLGNDIMRDDAIGLRVTRALASHSSLPPSVEVIETGEMGLSLLDVLVDRGWVILVDSVVTSKKPVGYIQSFIWVTSIINISCRIILFCFFFFLLRSFLLSQLCF